MTEERRLTSIVVGERYRRDMGNITELAASIGNLGLIHPVVILPDGQLVAGARRLRAMEQLGWDVVPVTVIHSLEDAASVLEAQQDENTCRKDFLSTEGAAIRAAINELLKPLAEQNRLANLKQNRGGNLPPREPIGKTRDVAAKGTGLSGRTLDKVDKVIEITKDESLPEPVREVARQALTKMDSKPHNVDKPFKEAMDAKAQAERPEALTAIDNDQELQDLRYIGAFGKLLSNVLDLSTNFDPARIAELADRDLLTSIQHANRALNLFASRVAESSCIRRIK